MNNQNSSAFIKILSRYTEVSHVYFLNILKEETSLHKREIVNVEDRFQRLQTLLHQLNLPKTSKAISRAVMKNAQGQSITSTDETFSQTKIYQDLVLGFLESDRPSLYNLPELQNRSKIISLLKSTPQEFLGSFPTVTYAWDTLTEIAYLYFLPSKESLSSRDFIYMHSVELMQHLSRLYIQVQRMDSMRVISLHGRFTISQLEQFQHSNEIVEKILGSSRHKHISELVDELLGVFSDEQDLHDAVYALKAPIMSRLEQVENGFPDILEEALHISDAKEICNNMVSFGLAIAYAIWLKFAKNDYIARGVLLKHCLFCSRNLLDEQRWLICKEITSIILGIIKSINEIEIDETKHANELMIKTNNFFARKMLKESISSELQVWDLSNAHPRYHFLQRILFDRLDEETFNLAKHLLMPQNNHDAPNMCIREFEEWPILESFRKSPYWERFISHAESLTN